MPESQYTLSAVISAGEANASFATINNATGINSTFTLVVNDCSYNTLNVSLNQTSTITGGVVTFEGSFDGVTYFPIQGFAPGTFASIGPTYTLIANTYAVFQFNLTGIFYFQIQLTTTMTGTGSVTIGYAADSFVNSIAVGGTVAISGTVAVTQSTSPWVVSLASTTITGTVAVTQSTSPWIVAGALTNNNAAPTATLIGVMGHIAETAYATVTYTTGDVVLATTDLHGSANIDLQAYAGTALGAGSNYGTSPGAVNVMGVNAFITNIPAVSQSGTWTVQQGSAPWIVDGALTNNNAAPTTTNIGVLPAIAETVWNTATYTTGNQVLPTTDLHGALWSDVGAVAAVQLGASAVVAFGSAPAATNVPAVNASLFAGVTGLTATGTSLNVDVTNTVTVVGNKTNNFAVPGATNIGALVAITAPSNTTFPVYVAGNENLLVTDLAGNTNVDVQYWGGSDLGAPTNFGTTPGAVIVGSVNASLFIGTVAAVAASAGVQKVGIVGNAGGAVDAVIGAVVPANAIQVGASDGTDLQALNTNVKGTQGGRGLAVQELKDAGRTYVILVLDAYTAVIGENLTTMTINKAGTTTTATEYTVTAGKTFRFQSMSFCLLSNTGSISGRARLRVGATVGTASSILCTLQTAAQANLQGNAEQSFPDGIEIAAGQQLGITQNITSTAAVISVTVAGYEY